MRYSFCFPDPTLTGTERTVARKLTLKSSSVTTLESLYRGEL